MKNFLEAVADLSESTGRLENKVRSAAPVRRVGDSAKRFMQKRVVADSAKEKADIHKVACSLFSMSRGARRRFLSTSTAGVRNKLIAEGVSIKRVIDSCDIRYSPELCWAINDVVTHDGEEGIEILEKTRNLPTEVSRWFRAYKDNKYSRDTIRLRDRLGDYRLVRDDDGEAKTPRADARKFFGKNVKTEERVDNAVNRAGNAISTLSAESEELLGDIKEQVEQKAMDFVDAVSEVYTGAFDKVVSQEVQTTADADIEEALSEDEDDEVSEDEVDTFEVDDNEADDNEVDDAFSVRRKVHDDDEEEEEDEEFEEDDGDEALVSSDEDKSNEKYADEYEEAYSDTLDADEVGAGMDTADEGIVDIDEVEEDVAQGEPMEEEVSVEPTEEPSEVPTSPYSVGAPIDITYCGNIYHGVISAAGEGNIMVSGLPRAYFDARKFNNELKGTPEDMTFTFEALGITDSVASTGDAADKAEDEAKDTEDKNTEDKADASVADSRQGDTQSMSWVEFADKVAGVDAVAYSGHIVYDAGTDKNYEVTIKVVEGKDKVEDDAGSTGTTPDKVISALVAGAVDGVNDTIANSEGYAITFLSKDYKTGAASDENGVDVIAFEAPDKAMVTFEDDEVGARKYLLAHWAEFTPLISEFASYINATETFTKNPPVGIDDSVEPTVEDIADKDKVADAVDVEPTELGAKLHEWAEANSLRLALKPYTETMVSALRQLGGALAGGSGFRVDETTLTLLLNEMPFISLSALGVNVGTTQFPYRTSDEAIVNFADGIVDAAVQLYGNIQNMEEPVEVVQEVVDIEGVAPVTDATEGEDILSEKEKTEIVEKVRGEIKEKLNEEGIIIEDSVATDGKLVVKGNGCEYEASDIADDAVEVTTERGKKIIKSYTRDGKVTDSAQEFPYKDGAERKAFIEQLYDRVVREGEVKEPLVGNITLNMYTDFDNGKTYLAFAKPEERLTFGFYALDEFVDKGAMLDEMAKDFAYILGTGAWDDFSDTSDEYDETLVATETVTDGGVNTFDIPHTAATFHQIRNTRKALDNVLAVSSKALGERITDSGYRSLCKSSAKGAKRKVNVVTDSICTLNELDLLCPALYKKRFTDTAWYCDDVNKVMDSFKVSVDKNMKNKLKGGCCVSLEPITDSDDFKVSFGSKHSLFVKLGVE